MHAGLFGDSGLDGGGYFYDQRHLCCRAEVQSGAHLLGIHYFRGFYRLSGAVGCGPHGAPLERIPIRVGERTRFLELSRITHFFTQGRLTFAASQGKSYCVDWTIAELEQKLGGSQFFRIHRRTLLNLEWLDELTPWFNGRIAARLKDEKRTDLTVARNRVRMFKERLGL